MFFREAPPSSPICSGCKKIRDERGRWHEVEAYVAARSEADFTHGICPGCLERLYPEFRPKKLAG